VTGWPFARLQWTIWVRRSDKPTGTDVLYAFPRHAAGAKHCRITRTWKTATACRSGLGRSIGLTLGSPGSPKGLSGGSSSPEHFLPSARVSEFQFCRHPSRPFVHLSLGSFSWSKGGHTPFVKGFPVSGGTERSSQACRKRKQGGISCADPTWSSRSGSPRLSHVRSRPGAKGPCRDFLWLAEGSEVGGRLANSL